jgi:mRNA interferase RelE/StbE
MPQRILFDELVKAQLRAIDKTTAMRILIALSRLLEFSEGDVKQLQGIDPPEYRLRVGDYRVRFRRVVGDLNILSVRHRRDAYR